MFQQAQSQSTHLLLRQQPPLLELPQPPSISLLNHIIHDSDSLRVRHHHCHNPPHPRSAEATLFPNLMVPIRQAEPNGAFGTEFTGTIFSTTATTESIPSSHSMSLSYETQIPMCQWTFALPAPNTGFPRTVSETGRIDLHALHTSNGIETSTWNTRPARGELLGRIQFVLMDKLLTRIEQSGAIPCSGGSRIEMIPVGEGQLEWFEMRPLLTGLTPEIFA